MKAGIHPSYEDVTITCACGNVVKVHELVDFVSAEGELAGTAAAKFALGAAGQN